MCKIGVHDYLYNFKGGRNAEEEDKQGSTRFCIECGKKQELDVHCLGLNPPQYIKKWYTI